MSPEGEVLKMPWTQLAAIAFSLGTIVFLCLAIRNMRKASQYSEQARQSWAEAERNWKRVADIYAGRHPRA
jgi:hypothetical protein